MMVRGEGGLSERTTTQREYWFWFWGGGGATEAHSGLGLESFVSVCLGYLVEIWQYFWSNPVAEQTAV